MQPWIDLGNFPANLWSTLHLKVFATNDRSALAPDLWCVCDISICSSVIASSSQHITFLVMKNNHPLYFSAIYAVTLYISRRSLWQELSLLKQSFDGPWCFIGDYNAVIGAHEHRGRRLPSSNL